MPLDQENGFIEQDLTLTIYDAVAAPERWPEVAASLQHFLRCDAVDFMMLDGRSGDQIVGHVSGDDPTAHRDYVDYYLATDIRIPRMNAKPALQILDDNELISREERRRSPFHNELLPRSGLVYTMGVRLAVAEPFIAHISCGQRGFRGPFQEEQRRRLALYLPHLQRAMNLRLTMWRLEAGQQLLTSAFDQLPFAAMVLTSTGQLLIANESARAITQAKDGLSLRHGHLEAAERDAQRQLKALLHDVGSAAAGGMTRKPHTSMRVERPSGRPAYRLDAHAVPRASVLWRDDQRAAILVLIADPDQVPVQREEALRMLYNLTPAEAALASAFSRGTSLREYAERRAISVETVRFQMKQILAKTDCRRQTDLVRLIISS